MKDAAKLRKKAMRAAFKFGFGWHAEDLAHDMLVSRLRGKGKKQSVNQGIVDAIRNEFGKPNRKKQKQRVSAKYIADIEGKLISPDSVLGYRKMVGILEMWERGIFNLYFEYGYSQIEIGKIFGVSGSYISLRMTEILASLKNRFKNE